MAIGLYIHVPFCVKKCAYCDFISYPYDAGLAASYVSALETEMALHAENMSAEHRTVKSIYLGGGTPTTLGGEQLAAVLDNCRRYFAVAGDAEITVECNPGTADLAKLKRIREAGATRLSMGVQACQEKLLSRLGRLHDWSEVVEAAENSKRAGFTNLSVDLIYGIPGQSMQDWQETLRQVTWLYPRHVSAYNLKIEPDTPLYRDVASGYLVPCDEELELEMYWYAVDFLAHMGFRQYEISNFARPGFEARHNLIYWHNEEYLGLGPAAHSMLNGHRFSNIKSVETYISRLQRKEPVIHEMHRLTAAETESETVFLGLRLIGGLDLDAFARRHGRSIFDAFGERLRKLERLGLIEIDERSVRLTEKGLPLANEVFAEFV